jgi:hypothetical protein
VFLADNSRVHNVMGSLYGVRLANSRLACTERRLEFPASRAVN